MPKIPEAFRRDDNNKAPFMGAVADTDQDEDLTDVPPAVRRALDRAVDTTGRTE